MVSCGLSTVASAQSCAWLREGSRNKAINSIWRVILCTTRGYHRSSPRRHRGKTQPVHSPILQPLGLNAEEREQLKAFLYALPTCPAL